MQKSELYRQTSHRLHEIEQKIQLIEYEIEYSNIPFNAATEQSLHEIRRWYREILTHRENLRKIDRTAWAEKVHKLNCLWQNILKKLDGSSELYEALDETALASVRGWHREIDTILESMGETNDFYMIEAARKIDELWERTQHEFVRILMNLPDVATVPARTK